MIGPYKHWVESVRDDQRRSDKWEMKWKNLPLVAKECRGRGVYTQVNYKQLEKLEGNMWANSPLTMRGHVLQLTMQTNEVSFLQISFLSHPFISVRCNLNKLSLFNQSKPLMNWIWASTWLELGDISQFGLGFDKPNQSKPVVYIYIVINPSK